MLIRKLVAPALLALAVVTVLPAPPASAATVRVSTDCSSWVQPAKDATDSRQRTCVSVYRTAVSSKGWRVFARGTTQVQRLHRPEGGWSTDTSRTVRVKACLFTNDGAKNVASGCYDGLRSGRGVVTDTTGTLTCGRGRTVGAYAVPNTGNAAFEARTRLVRCT